MSSEQGRDPITLRRVVYHLPHAEVRVRRDVKYGDADDLLLDLYYPPNRSAFGRPAVVIVTGRPDVGVPNTLGCTFKEMQMNVSWAELIAASGLIAVTYTTRNPVRDLLAVVHYIHEQSERLGIHRGSFGLFASSGNAPTALSLLVQDAAADVACAVLCCPFTLDLDGSTDVQEAARKWGFVDACAGKSISAFRSDVPLFIARAGQDQFGNTNIDRFAAAALNHHMPITVVNHTSGPHAFDLFDDSDRSRHIIREMLEFMRFHLLVEH